MVSKHKNETSKQLIVIRPIPEEGVLTQRLESILGPIITRLEEEGTEVILVEKVSELVNTEFEDTELAGIDMRGKRIIFAVALSDAGINFEYYRLLEYFRQHPRCLTGAVGGIIVDGSSDYFTKALARRLCFSANGAGCTFPGKPLVEATGSLKNFHVLSGITGKEPLAVYASQVEALFRKVLDFQRPDDGHPLRVLVVHASTRDRSNTLLLWEKIQKELDLREDVDPDIKVVSLRDGVVQDCRGCKYDACRHFGEQGDCFYGGIMTEQVYPAILNCDALVMLCPNYNDAISANLTAFINRLTALFRTHDFSQKRIYALVISGYSGGDIVSEQIIGAINFNKNFILPGRFAMVETANDPKSILDVPNIDSKARRFADAMW